MKKNKNPRSPEDNDVIANVKTTDNNKSALPFSLQPYIAIVNPAESEAIENFRRAYEIHSTMDKRDQSDIVEATHRYWNAFLGGCLEAGINLLAIIAMTLANAKANHIILREGIFQDKIRMVVNALDAIDNPYAPYFTAISMIYGISDSDLDEKTTFREGCLMIEDLAADGNTLAQDWLDKNKNALN